MKSRRSPATIEGLENRMLMKAPPKVISVIADNRGEVQITSSRTLTNISKSTVKAYTQGPDNILGTADDVRVPASVSYDVNNFRITVRATVAAGTGYRVGIDAKVVTSVGDVRRLDGEYLGTFPTGNGVPGGNFAVLTKNDKSTTPTVRMSTSSGVITMKMRGDKAPASVTNFLTYANSGKYDYTFFTRSIPNFIIQGGSIEIKNAGTAPATDLVEYATNASPLNEFNLSNTRGTIAFARGSGVNSATNQFFFNLGDNSANLDNQNGGFTVFGEITTASGLNSIDGIAAQPRVSLQNNATATPGIAQTINVQTASGMSTTGLTDVPTVSTTGLTTVQAQTDPQDSSAKTLVTGGSFNAYTQLVTIRRVAPLMRLAAIT